MYNGVHFLCVFHCLWKAGFLCQPISEYWNGTTTLIPFLHANKHFCNFIPSNFTEGFLAHTDKDLKSKNFKGKKFYILAKDINSNTKFEIKAKKYFGLKKTYFLGSP